MSFFRQLAKRTLTALLPRHAIVSRGAGPGIALTFDDGPHPDHTPRLLDALADAGITATFFIVGERGSEHRSLLQRIAYDGHNIGNHTWSHSEPRETSARQLIDEVRRTRDLIEDITGRECRLFRPPKGELTLRKLLALRQERQTIVLWNHDTKDYRMPVGSDAIIDWCRDYRPWSGDIVLFHDNHPHAVSAVEYFATQRPDLCERCLTVSELVNSSRSGRSVPQSVRGTLCTGS
ncbi:polysaccharide deacetylase family protein [bacterium]|nr:polysaccharide deacetylase family protein [bacterium]